MLLGTGRLPVLKAIGRRTQTTDAGKFFSGCPPYQHQLFIPDDEQRLCFDANSAA